MPELNGLQVLKRVRDDLDNDVPFIIFTGKGREEVAMEALNLGADRYLQKGGDPKSQYGVLNDAIVQEAERKEAEEKIKEEKRKRKVLIDNFPGYALILEKGSREIVLSNEAAKEDGAEPGKTCYETIAERENRCPFCKSPELWETNERQEIKAEYRGKHYHGIWIPFTEDLYVHYIFDITEQKEKEKELRRYKDIFEELNDPVVVKDLKGKYKLINKAGEEYLGFPEQKIIGKTDEELFGEEIGEKIWEKEKKVIENQEISTYEETLPTNKGKRTFKTSRIPYYSKNDDLKGIISISRDITERKKAEEQLKKSEEKYRNLFETMAQGVVYQDSGGNIISANPAAERILGLSVDQMKGRTSRHPEWKAIKEDGSPFPGDEHPAMIALRTGEEVKDVVMGVYHPEKEEYVWININAIPQFRKDEEEPYQVYTTFQDITERKKAEEREEFLHSLLRHDVQNKNQIVEGYLELLKENPEKNKRYVDKALRAAKESEDIIEKVRTLRELEKEEIENKKIDSVLNEVIEENRDRANERGIEIKKTSSSLKCKVKAGSLLRELFNNLIENAIQHSKGTKIKINCKETEKEDTVICSIEDNGKGIPDEQKEKVFEKGYKHGETGGSGLGMYLAEQIIENYDGDIEVKDSGLGGARFDVHLQRA